jgi:hypothetical protein
MDEVRPFGNYASVCPAVTELEQDDISRLGRPFNFSCPSENSFKIELSTLVDRPLSRIGSRIEPGNQPYPAEDLDEDHGTIDAYILDRSVRDIGSPDPSEGLSHEEFPRLFLGWCRSRG